MKEYRNKLPAEETTFPKNGIAEETSFHILHTWKKHPSIVEQTPYKFSDRLNKPPSCYPKSIIK
ncbi:hypothetical protein DPMN_000129 [Dreissena polymorpha]|uniref:Uncharacterized protein n=1 Tax=Dreissena polymorpha TaxID=45954 RepID=A0A9D4MF88_DREPO|nr:hypothetical protein DPMN_000129 [Dreissena polymorpha]